MPERQHRLSNGSYGRLGITKELNELGIRVGKPLPGSGLSANRERGRVGRLMRQNGIQVIRSRNFKRTTGSDHAFNFAPNLLQQDFTASGPNQKWPYGGASTAYRLIGRRYHLCLDVGGLDLSGRDH
jgi:putative transposase